jgi:signal transduction histidine kinase
MPALDLSSRRTADRTRRSSFLRLANRCWLAMGFVGLVAWPFYRRDTVFYGILLASSVVIYLIVAALLRGGRVRAAALVFCVLSNQTIFGMMILNYYTYGFSYLEANLMRVSALAFMGLTIVVAGATIGPIAAGAFAVLNTLLLVASILFVDSRLGPKVSIPFYWAMLGATVWYYERQVKESLDAAQTANESLDHTVEERTAELRRAKGELEMAVNELEAFSYSVAHDLRAPLRHINAFAGILEEEAAGGLSPEARSALSAIVQQSRKMNRLIGDLLDLSRVARAPLHRMELDFSAMAGEIVRELEGRDPARRVRTDIMPGLKTNADAGLAQILLSNLLGNAWKFSEKTPEARIEFGRTTDGAFFVRDNGAGFDMSQAHRLFQPFERLHGPSEFAGTGIGLAIVHRIVRRHGGTIRAEGTLERGATFTFTLGG